MSNNLRRAMFGGSRRNPTAAELVVSAITDHQAEKRDRRNRLDNLPVDPDLPIQLHGVIKWSDYRITKRGHDTECWIWENGKMIMEDPTTGQRKPVEEIIYHRIAREKLPKGKKIITRCGNYESRSIRERAWTLRTPIDEDLKPDCINPEHFSVISKAENDVINQIRHRNTKEITQDQRQTIAKLGKRHDWTEKERCLVFSVSRLNLRDDARAHRARGFAKARREDYTGAIADFDQAITLDPDNAEAYVKRGTVRSQLEDRAGAIADFDQAITLNPDNVDAYSWRGAAKGELGDYTGAIADFDRAIVLDPNNLPAYITRGAVKSGLENYPGAIADFDQTIALDPDYADAYSYRGSAKVELEEYADAIADFDQAIALDPDNTLAHSKRGIAKAKLEGRTESITDFDQASAPDPSLPVQPTVETEATPEPQTPAASSVAVAKKSKTVAGWLAFILGGLGAHKFYLGYTGAGIAHLALSLTIIGAPVNALICIAEFLIYMTKSDEEFHQTYVVNKRRFF